MILCSCNRLTCKQVKDATQEAICTDAAEHVSPGRVFKMCGHRVCCGACSALVHSTIAEHSATIRNQELR